MCSLFHILLSVVTSGREFLQVMLETEQQETEERLKEDQQRKLATREQRCERRIRRVLFSHDGQLDKLLTGLVCIAASFYCCFVSNFCAYIPHFKETIVVIIGIFLFSILWWCPCTLLWPSISFGRGGQLSANARWHLQICFCKAFFAIV